MATAVDTALVVCPARDGDEAGRRILGLTVGERLLLALHGGGVRRIGFAGPGPRPTCARAQLTEVDVAALGDGGDIVVVAADTVFDRRLLGAATVPAGRPLARVSAAEAAAAAADPTAWLLGRAGDGAVADFALRVTDDASARLAERALLRALRKPADGIVSRNINRYISLFITRWLSRTPVRPNQVTFVVLLIGLLAGPLAYQGTYAGFALGGACYYVSAIFDGIDGELARLKYLGSPLGVWFDTATDDVVALAWLCGLYTGLDRSSDFPYWGTIGAAVIGCFLIAVFLRYWLFITRIGAGDHQQLQRPPNPDRLRVVKLAHDFGNVVARTDFLPFYAFVTSVVGLPIGFAAPYAPGVVFGLADTVALFLTAPPGRRSLPDSDASR